ncbi:MAG TPA: VWA domain-containing protein [Candidatus Saccharimonadales bacterium]|nr:VWA domain-containing protein [Candidatus Saccharimonadales bacterium]
MLKDSLVHLPQTIIEFSRFARARGLSVGVTDTLVAAEAAEAVGIADRDVFKFALRSAFCSSKEDWDLFDPLFESFWVVSRPLSDSPFPNSRRSESSKSKTSHHLPAQISMPFGSAGGERQASEEGGRAVSGASALAQLKKTDFAAVPHHDQAALEQIAMRLLRQMSLRLSRRLQPARPSGQVDLRRTIRRNISGGGDPLYLLYRWKKLRPSRLVVLLDISGSMNLYSLFLARFAYALQKHFRHVHTFAFSTGLVEITGALKARDLSSAFQALSQQAPGWSGGTMIGESLAEFNRLHGRRLLTRDTLLTILSDGWDTGEPEVLVRQLKSIRLRVKKLIWLNPLLGLADYQPVTQAMNAALPYIDVFAPAHNLESLLALERHLSRGGAPRRQRAM